MFKPTLRKSWCFFYFLQLREPYTTLAISGDTDIYLWEYYRWVVHGPRVTLTLYFFFS